VQSVSSGVIFTRSPESLLEQCVISAGFGLGEGVVANIVETDTYRISFDLKEISKERTVKNRRVVRDKRGGTHIEAVPDELKSMQVLTDEQIRQLAGDAVKIEKSFGVPQDIEWAFDESGRLFILQARPIVIRLQKGSVEVRLWDNSNIIEGYPGITLPLTFSFIRKGYETLFRNASLSFLFFKKDIKRDLHIFKNMIGLLQGRVYYNLLNWYRMMSYLPGFKKYKESWDQMIGITEKLDFPESSLSPVNHLYAITVVIWRLLGIKRTARKFYALFNSVYDRFKNMELSAAGEDELIALYNSLEQELLRKWHLTLYNDFCAIKYYDWLKKLCCMWGLQGSGNLHNDLLVGVYGVESVSPVHSLIRIAAMIGAAPTLSELFSEDDDQVIWEKILNERAYGALKTALEEHLQAFGDRGVEELKLEKPSFREVPASLIRIIKNYYQLALSEEKMEVQKQEIRAGAETIVRQRLKNPFKRLLFWFVLRNARLAIANRENMRFDRSRLFGIVRRLFQRMGELFAEKGVLEAETDIYYLTVEEVFGFVEGAAVTQDLKALVKLRKAEYTEFAGYNLKERIRTVGSPYLNPLSEDETSGVESKTLKGIGCSSGVVKGTAKVVLDPAAALCGGNNILVARSTDPGWVFLMIASKGILVERGSLLSHTAIIGRELGIPTIVGVKDATKLIPDGALLFMDGGTGEVRWR
jgi:rifampicin phosphotransferase